MEKPLESLMRWKRWWAGKTGAAVSNVCSGVQAWQKSTGVGGSCSTAGKKGEYFGTQNKVQEREESCVEAYPQGGGKKKKKSY
jgi:hypothetical protein